MKEIIQNAFFILNSSQKKRGIFIVALLVFQSLLDFFGIASFLPVVFLIINPGFITSNETARSIYGYFEFSSTGNFVIAITLLVLLFTVAKAIVSYGINRTKGRYVFGVASELSNRSMERYLESGYPGFSDADFSREVNRINNHPITFANNILLPITNLISEGLIFIFITTCVIVYDIQIILLLAGILIPFVILYRFIKKNTKRISLSIKEKYPLSLKYAQQLVEAFIEIKVSAKEHFFSKRFNRTTNELSEAFTADHVIQNSLTRLTEIIAAFIICMLVIYTVMTGQTYQQSILILSIYAGASFRIIPSINRIFMASIQVRTHEFIIQELNDLIHFRPSIKTQSHNIVFTQQLELKNLSFYYPGHQAVLQNINLSIRKGSKVALTGKSGEGKTTLLLILLGFLKEYSGEIWLDNKIIQGDSVRMIMGYVPQNPYILDATIAENIAFGELPENIDRKKIHELLRDLDLLDLIKQLPEGIDSPIGERGVKLSGGQRQRITLARALYTNADILLIDEATNQVHHSLELEILKLLEELRAKGKTIIVITHKLSAQSNFDFIYQLENGKLVETTSFSNFLK